MITERERHDHFIGLHGSAKNLRQVLIPTMSNSWIQKVKPEELEGENYSGKFKSEDAKKMKTNC